MRLVRQAVGLVATAATLLPALPLAAQTPDTGEGVPASRASAAPRTYVNLRAGGSSANDNGRPEICLEGAPLSRLSFETCGTGLGLLHDAEGTELFHLRAKYSVLALPLGGLFLEPGVGLGMAELQVGLDDPGFRFGGTGPRQVETAGPEASVFLRGTAPVGMDLELVLDAQLGAAYLPHAPELVLPRAKLQPFATLSVGVGF